jgi:transposase
VFGKPWLPGCLGGARYGGSHKGPCAIQYGSSHRLREVQDRETECPETVEVTAFVRTVAPPLALALGRRAHPISDAECARLPGALNAQLLASMDAPSHHLGLRRLQELLRAHADRLYHGAEDRRVPAENHVAERDLRPPVIARNVSFGSPSDAGARSRGILRSVRHTLKKRGCDLVAHLTGVLDQLADALHQDPWPLLFPEAPT